MTRESSLHDSPQVSEVARLCGLVVLHKHISGERSRVVPCRMGRSIQLGSKDFAGGPN